LAGFELSPRIQFRPEEKAKGKEVEKEQKLTAICGKFDLTDYINAWESLPPLKPPVPIDLPAGGTAAAAGVGAAYPGAPVVAEIQIAEIDPELPQA